jgi:hypothetical protein
MKTFLLGFFCCLSLALCTAAIHWEPVFSKFGPLLIKAQMRAEVAEFNRARQWDAGLKQAVADAISLADLKVRVATLPNRPDITASNVYTEVTGYITEYENE